MGLSYKQSGVDMDRADRLVDFIQKRAPAIGGFSGLFNLKLGGSDSYQLAASTDGVGSKLKVACALDRHDTVGIDLVAMCVNDLIVCGAKPLFFLDYYATAKLDLKRSKKLLSGIMEGCRLGRMVLLGGETAEMPGFYNPGEYDLAGFAVGIVKTSEIIDGRNIHPGDEVVAFPSSGLHSNGFSLVRRIFKGALFKKWAPELIRPTRVYVGDVARLSRGLGERGHEILGLAHITGGGLVENVPRILPENARAVFETRLWRIPSVFSEMQDRGRIAEPEMWRTFNMGIGMIAVVRPAALPAALKILPGSFRAGRIIRGKAGVEIR